MLTQSLIRVHCRVAVLEKTEKAPELDLECKELPYST